MSEKNEELAIFFAAIVLIVLIICATVAVASKYENQNCKCQIHKQNE